MKVLKEDSEKWKNSQTHLEELLDPSLLQCKDGGRKFHLLVKVWNCCTTSAKPVLGQFDTILHKVVSSYWEGNILQPV